MDFAPGRRIVARILVVEDSPDNMKLFRTLLTLEGHEVTGLPGRRRSCSRPSRRTDPELVLMDIQLPGQGRFHAAGRDPAVAPCRGSGCWR